MSVLAHTVDDATLVERIAAGYDPNDQYSRRSDGLFGETEPDVESVRIGVPERNDLEFFGNEEAEAHFEEAVAELEASFGPVDRIDFAVFEEAADLLYNGPWVAERLTTVGAFIKDHPDDIDLTVRGIIRDGEMYSASDAFEAFHRIERLRTDAAAVFEDIDALVVPTIPTVYTIEDEQLHPLEINSELGTYTNFVNLLDLSAVSVPTGRYAVGPTFSVSVIGEAFDDRRIAAIGDAIHDPEAAA